MPNHANIAILDASNLVEYTTDNKRDSITLVILRTNRTAVSGYERWIRALTAFTGSRQK
jgi:hypothetical protein